jgi:hypothetical protein
MPLPPEEWRELPFAIRYEVSNYGKVRKKAHLRRKYIVQKRMVSRMLTRDGIEVWIMQDDGAKRRHRVSRLVAEAFIPPRGKGRIVFIDGDITNCCSWNLRRLDKAGKTMAFTPEDKVHLVEDIKLNLPTAYLKKKYRVSRITIQRYRFAVRKAHERNYIQQRDGRDDWAEGRGDIPCSQHGPSPTLDDAIFQGVHQSPQAR